MEPACKPLAINLPVTVTVLTAVTNTILSEGELSDIQSPAATCPDISALAVITILLYLWSVLN